MQPVRVCVCVIRVRDMNVARRLYVIWNANVCVCVARQITFKCMHDCCWYIYLLVFLRLWHIQLVACVILFTIVCGTCCSHMDNAYCGMGAFNINNSKHQRNVLAGNLWAEWRLKTHELEEKKTALELNIKQSIQDRNVKIRLFYFFFVFFRLFFICQLNTLTPSLL